MSGRGDVIVLGAGIVGVSVALHLQKRGRDVVLIDRQGAGEETSYGNAGLIQREAVIPYTFPRELSVVLSYAMNHRRDVRASSTRNGLPSFLACLFTTLSLENGGAGYFPRRLVRPLLENGRLTMLAGAPEFALPDERRYGGIRNCTTIETRNRSGRAVRPGMASQLARPV